MTWGQTTATSFLVTDTSHRYKAHMVAELQLPVLRRFLLLFALMIWFSVATIVYPGWGFVICVASLSLALFCYWMLHINFFLSTSSLLLGLTALLLAATWQYPYLPFPYLFGIVVAIGIFLIGLRTGILLALVMSGWLFWSYSSGLPLPTYTLEGSLLLLWLTLLTVALGTQPMKTLTEWSWQHFVRARQRTAQLEEYQAKLSQTLTSLDLAYKELAKTNRKLTITQAIAEEARQSKAEFVANVSHELRTPINMITGFTEMILRAPRTYAAAGLPPALLADLDVVLRNAQHLSDLVNDILDLSQLDVGRMGLVREWTSLDKIAQFAVAAIAPLAEARQLTMKLTVADSLPAAFIDKMRIRQVILNLLSNAVRFTEVGGVEVEVSSLGDTLVVCVRDTGPGIAAQDIPKLFEPFRQVDGSLRRRYGGTGLGLHISRSFAALHGGDISVESEVGKGTTIWLTLPIEENVPPSHTERGTDPAIGQAKTAESEFVVVEPKPVLERIFRRYLTDGAVLTAPDLETAMKISRNQTTRAIILRTVHAQDSWLLLEGTRRMQFDAPLIVCTMPGLPESYLEEHGLAGYLLKPVAREQLLNALRQRPEVKNVLLVDDDVDFRRLFTRMLKTSPQPYTVWQAMNGREALAILGKRRPDAIFLDVMLPDLNGLQLLEKIRGLEGIREVPVFFITAQDASGSPLVASFLEITHRGGLSIDELIRCVRAVGDAFRGATPPLNRIAEDGLPSLDPTQPAVVPG
ncbi:MAG: response regulator [Caldilineaceae bacterium]|nr:response regulator [Caldilineaceae bacterium]